MCGILGIVLSEDCDPSAANFPAIAADCLMALQHRLDLAKVKSKPKPNGQPLVGRRAPGWSAPPARRTPNSRSWRASAWWRTSTRRRTSPYWKVSPESNFSQVVLCFLDSVALLGHNRYSTAGMKAAINCIQPFVLHTVVGRIAIAHNGELVNAHRRRVQVSLWRQYFINTHLLPFLC